LRLSWRASGGGASAADLAVKAPPPSVAAAPVSDWSGFYVGINGGGGWANTDFQPGIDLLPPDFPGYFQPPGQRSSGGLIGGQFGYNWQFGRFVAGLEADYDAADIKSTANLGSGITQELKINQLGSVRGRFGWTVWPDLLAYGTAGFALGKMQSSFDQPSSTLSTAGYSTESGWAAGAGLEYKLLENILLRAEYLHYDFGRVSDNNNGAGTIGGDNSNSRTAVDVVRAGVSYKFSPAGPADLLPSPAVKAPAPASASGWSGFYAGVNGGFGWAHTSFPMGDTQPALFSSFGLNNPVQPPAQNSSGGLIGGHFGYNWQYGRAVAGLETDYDVADIKSTASLNLPLDPPGSTISNEVKIDQLASVRARLGWTVWPDLLAYGTAGLAVGHLQPTATQPSSSLVATGGETTFGWAAGAGLEYKVLENLAVRAEYLHYDFGTASNLWLATSSTPTPLDSSAARTTVDIVRAGLSYKFGPAAADSDPSFLVKAKAAAAPGTGWSGLYAGIDGGGGWANTDFPQGFAKPAVNGVLPPPPSQNSNGGLIGGHVGYNWQYGQAVAGLELDYDAADIKSTANTFAVPLAPYGIGASEALNQALKIDQLASIRTRLGWTIWPDLLAYGTAGVGMGHFQSSVTETTPAPLFVTAGGATTFGWVAGGGVEYKLLDHVMLRAEYLHYDFGRQINLIQSGDSFTYDSSLSRTTVDAVRGGVSYKF
jgi:opacity protein-like surface antigen